MAQPPIGVPTNRTIQIHQTGDVIPRRARLDRNTHEELLIRTAVDAIEKLPAHPKLTEAIVLLGEARNRVADYVDELPTDWQALADRLAEFRHGSVYKPDGSPRDPEDWLAFEPVLMAALRRAAESERR